MASGGKGNQEREGVRGRNEGGKGSKEEIERKTRRKGNYHTQIQ